MPGLVGFIGDTSPDESRTLIESMAAALHPEPRFRKDLYTTQGLGLGRVSLGLVNSAPQPIWNEDHSICVVMEGEIYDYQDLKRKLVDKGYQFASKNNDAEFILHLYEEEGEDFVSELNGQFAIAIWDQRQQTLILAKDFLGLVPLYYAQCNGRLLFASGVRAILADPSFPREVDLIAAAQFLTFDHLLDDRTLVEAVKLLPPGTTLTYQHGRVNVKSYWKPQYGEISKFYTEQDYIDGLITHLHQAVSRQSPGDLTAGFLLSGGLDSRVLLAFFNELITNDEFHTFTFGIPGCDDARFAYQASSLTRASHHYYELKPSYLISLAQEGIRLTDGLQNCIHMHSLATLEKVTGIAELIYKGFAGDVLMGFGHSRDHLANINRDVIAQYSFNLYQKHDAILFNFEQVDELFSDDKYSQVNGAAYEIFRNVLVESDAVMAADRVHYFYLRYRIPRMTLNGVELVRSRASVRMPFCDRDLVEYMLTVPAGYRFERYLMEKAFIQAFPDLAKIPYTSTGLPLYTGMRSLLMQGDQHLRWYLRNHGLPWVPVKRKTHYADYNGWMRTELRKWVEDILLDKFCLGRGYFKPQTIRNLVSEHMNGTNHAPRLGALISLELWQRMFID
jgi:asparagine synthase (glutamine-hydrolysing)